MYFENNKTNSFSGVKLRTKGQREGVGERRGGGEKRKTSKYSMTLNVLIDISQGFNYFKEKNRFFMATRKKYVNMNLI